MEIVLEALREVRRRVKAHHVTYLHHLILLSCKEFCTLIEPYDLDIIIRGLTCNTLHLLVEITATHIELLSEFVNIKIRVTEVIKNNLIQLLYKLCILLLCLVLMMLSLLIILKR